MYGISARKVATKKESLLVERLPKSNSSLKLIFVPMNSFVHSFRRQDNNRKEMKHELHQISRLTRYSKETRPSVFSSAAGSGKAV